MRFLRIPAAGVRSSRALARSVAAVLAVVLLVASAPSGLQAQSVELRYQFTDGLDLRYQMTQTTSMTLPGGMGAMDQEQAQVMRLQVLSVDGDGNARIRSSIESIRIDIQSPMGSQSYDSTEDSEPTDPALAPLSRMIGTGNEVVIGADGRVVDAGDLTESFEEMTEGMSDEERAMLEQMFTPEALENMISQSFQVLPQGAVDPGDAWESSFTLPMPFGTLSTEFVYTLEGVEERNGSRIALIGITGTMGEIEADPDNPMAAMMQFQGGDISGTAEFNVDRGIFVASTTRTEIGMNVMDQTMTSVSETEMRLIL